MKIKKLLKSKYTNDEVKNNKNTLQLTLTEKRIMNFWWNLKERRTIKKAKSKKLNMYDNARNQFKS